MWEICEKEVYVMREICEKDVYVMWDMKKCLCDGREGKRCLCDGREGKRCLCDGREGVPITNLPPPKRVFSPAPPSLENRKRVFTSNLQTL